MSRIEISLKNLNFNYGNVRAVNDVSLKINKGELVSILGPSGCGKTTLLRLIAGLLSPIGGEIYFNNDFVNYWSPQQRNAVMVFQSYALFPHMTVEENIQYGLLMKKMEKSEIIERTKNIMEKVQLIGLEKRKPEELSGGQQQRTALARALVVEPKVLLFDEPLSNLDENLRVSMRQKIRSIQKEFRITSIYVTHDQEEAMAISDKIVIMKDGKVQQAGIPRDIYENPINIFSAKFMGECNVLKKDGKDVFIRPQSIKITEDGVHEGVVIWTEYLGSITKIKVLWETEEIIIQAPSEEIKEYVLKKENIIRFNM